MFNDTSSAATGTPDLTQAVHVGGAEVSNKHWVAAEHSHLRHKRLQVGQRCCCSHVHELLYAVPSQMANYQSSRPPCR